MKIGFFLRKKLAGLENLIRRILETGYYIIWLMLDPSKFKKINSNSIKKILVRYEGALGDTYNLLGIIQQLKENYPHLQIYFLTNRKNRKFIKSKKINILDLKKASEFIKKNEFDALVTLSPVFSDKLDLNVLKIPYRISCDSVGHGSFLKRFPLHALFLRKWPLFSTRRMFPFYRNAKWFFERNGAFKILGFNLENKLRFYFTKEAEKDAIKFIKNKKISKKEKIIFFHVGGGTISKAIRENKIASHKWPSKNWADLGNFLIKENNARIIFTGVNEDKFLINEVISQIKYKNKVINTYNKLSIEQIASLLKKANLLITIDTSMAHIGAQAGVPLIDLFGPFDPKLATPITKKAIFLFHKEGCNSCRRYACPEKENICMKAIGVKEVIKASNYLLKKYNTKTKF